MHMTDLPLAVAMRWLHIASVVTLIGGMLFGSRVLEPALSSLSAETRDAVWRRASAHLRPLVYVAICLLVFSGLYNIFSNPGHTVLYHTLLGVKLLLVLHVFAVAFLAAQPVSPRRARLMTGAMISGLIIIAISAYLRKIF